jgi:hypothetical protein
MGIRYDELKGTLLSNNVYCVYTRDLECKYYTRGKQLYMITSFNNTNVKIRVQTRYDVDLLKNDTKDYEYLNKITDRLWYRMVDRITTTLMGNYLEIM